MEHLRDVAGVAAVHADFLHVDLGPHGPFDVITFNKVLEHVLDPVAMLRRATPLLAPDGVVYLEVPDAAAAAAGFGREEFFIDHHHVFTVASASLLAERAGLQVAFAEQLREPSSKFTIRMMLTTT